MVNLLMDKQDQRKAELTWFFDSNGWRHYEAELNMVLAHYQDLKQKLELQPITEDKLAAINFYLGCISAVQRILLVKDQLVEEVTSSPTEGMLNNPVDSAE